MTSPISTVIGFLNRFRRIGDRALAGGNAVVGGLVVITNGSALILTLGGADPTLVGRVWQMAILTTAGATLLLFSLLVFFRRDSMYSLLRLQALTLFVLSIAVALLGLDLTFQLRELADRAVWQFGLLTLLGGYSGALMTRYVVADWAVSAQAWALMSWVTAVVAVDFLVAVRVGS
jgi:hypothetical protein